MRSGTNESAGLRWASTPMQEQECHAGWCNGADARALLLLRINAIALSSPSLHGTLLVQYHTPPPYDVTMAVRS